MPQESTQKKYETLFTDLCRLYDDTLLNENQKNEQKLRVYWQMGDTIVSVIGNPKRKVQYGKKFITRLSSDLTQKYGKGFKTRTVRYFRDFATQYTKDDLNPTLSWSHYRALLSVADKSERHHLEQRVITDHLTKTELEKIISLSRRLKNQKNTFPLSPRIAQTDIFKITDIEPNTKRILADLGFNVQRRIALPGVQPIPGTYVKQISPRKFESIIIQPGERYCYTGTLLNVIDGDTVKMRINLRFDTSIDVYLRLRGVDAMEINTKEGQKAKRALTRLLKNKTTLTVFTYHHDRYGRYIADLITEDDTYINKQLVEKGHAQFLKM